MVAHNEHTGDLLRSKAASETYRNNYDLIFGKKKTEDKHDEVATTTLQDTAEPKRV